jgi:hypothetical protein
MNDDEFIHYQLDHYFKGYSKSSNLNYIDAVNDYIKNTDSKINFTWIEIINKDSTDIYFIENSNCCNIMSNKLTLLEDYNLDIIKNQTKLIKDSITIFPFLIIRSGWDISFLNINQPCLLRTSRRKNNDFGVLIPDSSTQSLYNLNNFKNIFGNINFKLKNNTISWRGAMTGNCSIDRYTIQNNLKTYSRLFIVNKFYNKHDIKFIKTNFVGMESRENILISGQYSDYSHNVNLAKIHKYQIALNGNTFAGSYGWNLLSNSIVFHPDYDDNFYTYINPRKNIEYIPILETYEDLDEKIDYFNNNPDEAEIIATNGKIYIDQLLRLSYSLTKQTMDKIYLLYNQNTLTDATNLMNTKLTHVNVILNNDGNFIFNN